MSCHFLTSISKKDNLPNNQQRDGRIDMTIVVGIICKNGVVMASDSQAESFRGVKVKRVDYHKIVTFPATEDLYIAVSGAGVGTFISKATDKLKEKYESTKIATCDELANTSEGIMVSLSKRYVVDKMEALGLPPSQDIKNELELNFILLVGCTNKSGEELGLYTVHPDGIAERGEKFSTIGSGSAYAEYLLTKMYKDGLSTEQGKQLAVFVIEEVKRIDPGCGGPTQVVVLDKDGIHKLTPEEVKAISENLYKTEGCTNGVWWAVVNGEKSCDAIDKFLGSH
ncbi:MAG TPA: hypothetical protein VMS75_02185 [Terriglobales bacterium]|nr:hypothetical protein [Terriglobales bacterium]